MSICNTCKRADRDCPVYPQATEQCVEYRIEVCKARQYSDEMQCGRCGLTWDVNDSDRPACLTEGANAHAR